MLDGPRGEEGTADSEDLLRTDAGMIRYSGAVRMMGPGDSIAS
jgi:hypothetical protein